ncbi:MAG TPA: efflux RND transporter periplasmic adaptor subunit [Desulfobacterales bacterium]
MTLLRIGNSISISTVLGFLALAVALWACSETDSAKDGKPSAPTPVRVVQVEQQDLQETLTAVGSLAAAEKVTIRPEISGIVRTISFREGQRVKRDQLLFSLDDEAIRQRLQAGRAALKAAEAEAQNARKMLVRRRELLVEGTIAAETFDAVQTRYETAAARVERLKAEIGEIRVALDNTEIRSPIDGITGARRIDPGDFVEIGDPLVTIVRTDVLEIEFTVAERYANRVGEGQPVRIRTAANPERFFQGSVFFLSPQIREDTRDLLLKAEVANPNGLLRPGGFANVELILQVRKQARVLPEEALVPTRSGYIVFVVQEGKARRREVTIGLRRPGIVEIRSGLQSGETVIRSGHISVSDGDRIEVAGDAQS